MIGSTAGVTFSGERIGLTYSGNSGRGVMEIFIDGALYASLNQYAPSLQPQRYWESGNLAPGAHTLLLHGV